MRAVAVLFGLLLLGGCGAEAPPRTAAPAPASTPAPALPDAPLADLARQFDTSGLGPLAATGTTGPVSFAGAGDRRVAGALYLPSGAAAPAPAVVLLPGTDAGHAHLATEAAGWQSAGFVALAIDARWSADRGFPRVDAGDAALLRDTVIDTRRSLDLLATRPDVDPRRLAVVGHSYGGMVSPVVGAVDPRVRAAVAVSAHGRSTDWLLPQLQRASAEYRATMAPLEPSTYVAKVTGRPLLIQYDPDDRLMSQPGIDDYAARAGAAATVQVHRGAGHACEAQCRAARLSWTRERLAA